MADTVTGPTILQQNDKRVVIKIVNQSDGSGGSTVFADVDLLYIHLSSPEQESYGSIRADRRLSNVQKFRNQGSVIFNCWVVSSEQV